jgi:hypothetical protein
MCHVMYSAFVRLGKELHGCVPLLGAFVSDIVAGPNPMEDGKFLRGIGQVVNARLRPQPNRSRLGCRVAAVSDHCVTEHHLEFERQTLAFWVLRKPFQHSERTGVQWPPH